MAEHPLKRPNVFQVDRSAAYREQEKNITRDIRISCPHCGVLGMFPAAITSELEYPKFTDTEPEMLSHHSASVHICPNRDCSGLVFVISNRDGVIECRPSQSIDFNSENVPDDLDQPRLIGPI